MPGELIHLDLALVHPKYRGLTHEELLSALRVDLTGAPMDVAVAMSWLLAEGLPRVELAAGGQTAAPGDEIGLEVLEDLRVAPAVAEEVEEARGQPALPLVRLLKPGRHRLG